MFTVRNKKIALLLSVVMLFSILFEVQVDASDNQNNVDNNIVSEGIVEEDSSNIQNSNSNANLDDDADMNGNTEQESTTSQIEEESIQNESQVSDKLKSQGLINYITIDKPYVETPSEQNIVVSYGDGSANITDASLVGRKDDGSILKMQLTRKENELFLFTYNFDEDESGVYELEEFTYTQDEISHTILLADIGIESMFGVNEEYPGYNAISEDVSEEAMDQELEVSVVDVKTGEVEKATTDLEEAIEATEENMNNARASKTNQLAISERTDDLIVVLDPGHGGSDGGAAANGLVEKNLNLKIAQYCKEELEQYNNVTVYMTREDDTYLTVKERVDKANSLGADVLVSIHINSAGASANGAEVYYPNANYNPSVSSQGMNLAQQIQNQLVSLGLTNRGIKIRDSVSDSFPDGSKKDYYGIIRYSKEYGFPGIIVEHAFISNPNDAAKLAQDSFLKQLGVADATGIANTYGLSKVNIVGTGETQLSTDEKICKVSASISEGEEAVKSICVAVWGDSNGANDLKWYDLQKQRNNKWEISVDISNHKESGLYYADIYAVRDNGTLSYLDTQTFTISSLIAQTEVSEYDNKTGTFELTAYDIESPSGVKTVKFAVWNEDDSSNTLYWYTAERENDGTYKAIVNIKNHNYSIGTYVSHIYITGENGVETSLVAGNCEVSMAEYALEINDVSKNGTREHLYRIMGSNIDLTGAIGFQVAVWGGTDGGSNLKWYDAKYSNGKWYSDIDISNHKVSGQYYADVYLKMSNGVLMYAKTFEFTVSSPTAKVSVGAYDKESGTFELTAYDIESPSGVEEIKFPVWSEKDPSNTLYWYIAEKQSDGTYKATVNVKNHNYSIGTYTSHIYITGGNSVETSLVAGNIQIDEVVIHDFYTIMGTTSITVEQMINYYNSLGVTYPAEALGKGGAPSISEFCAMVYQEAEAEGVKGEVAFAQILVETGNLQFGGDVKIEQFNFGGLGATGNGVAGNSFPDVRTGIRANVQHLKCYASDEPLNNELVDPRWGEWLRKKACYVQWLSIPNNPYGTGWAADKDYASKILNIISKLKKY